jgi:quinol monooxygenase YgiN
MSDQYALCVIFRVKPDLAEEFAGRVEDNVTETRKDAGLIVFNYHKFVGEPTWILYDIWESEENSNLHRQKPDVQEFFAQAQRLLAQPPEIFRLQPSV